MLHRRQQCEVRVCQARHLRKSREEEKKSAFAAEAVWVLVSVDGKHDTTEGCRDTDNPSWQRVSVFGVDLREDAAERENSDAHKLPATGPAAATTAGESRSTARRREGWNSRRSVSDVALPATAAAATYRRTNPALGASGERLLSSSATTPSTTATAGAVAAATVPTRKRQSSFSSSRNPFATSTPEDTSFATIPSQQAKTQSLNPFASNFVPPPPPPSSLSSLPPSAAASTPTSVPALPSSSSPPPPPPPLPPPRLRTFLVLHLRLMNGRLRAREVLGDIAVDLVPLLRSDGNLLATDRLERCTKATTSSEERHSGTSGSGSGSGTSSSGSLCASAAEEENDGTALSAAAAASDVDAAAALPLFRELRELFAQGIPASLLQQEEVASSTGLSGVGSGGGGGNGSGGGGGGGGSLAGKGMDSRVGGAFTMGGEEEEEEEASFLAGVVTSIPRVEVTHVSGTICCAEYQLQVKRERGQRSESWSVLRRYSDFVELYKRLPRDLHAPMPPKSWRSLSFLSMTPEFLEDRRVALEVALRRVTIGAVQSEPVAQAELRAFLGFPPMKASPGPGAEERLAGVDAEVARHLVRVPQDLELSLPEGVLARSLPLLGNLRVVMWMLLSGAAHKVSVTDSRVQYKALAGISEGDETDWCRGGGSAKDFSLATLAFEIIRSDVNRTNVSSSAERERMRRVLRAFALKEPRIGYCQGMNSVALFLLRTTGGREDVAFWLLDALATTVIPGHWEQLSHIATPGAGVVTIRLLLAQRIPHLLEHLDKNLPPEVLVCDFLLSLGCRSLPPATLWRCFDLLFSEGRHALLFITMAVLRLAEEKLLGARGASETAETLVKCTATMHDADLVIETARSEMERGIDPSGAGITTA